MTCVKKSVVDSAQFFVRTTRMRQFLVCLELAKVEGKLTNEQLEYLRERKFV